MRSLMRNRRAIAYKNYLRTEYEEDASGRKTGHRVVVYDEVATVYGTVSAPTGSTSLQMFGTDENYSKVIVLDKPDIQITENSVFWIDKPYAEGKAHDYIVRRVVRNRNFLFIGLRKVDVAYAEKNNP